MAAESYLVFSQRLDNARDPFGVLGGRALPAVFRLAQYDHVANQIAPLGVEANVHEQGGLYRVSVGPYPTRDEARRTADRMRAALGLESTIKTR